MKKILSLALAMLMLFTLAACGQTPPPASPSAAPTGDPAVAPTDATGAVVYDTVKIMLSCNGTDQGNDTRTAKLFKEMIEEKSGGKVTVEVYNNDALASSNMTSAPELILNGTVQMDVRSTSVLAVVCENLKVSTLPFIFDDYAETVEYMWGKGGDYYAKILGEIGLDYLGGVHNGLKCFTNSKKLIVTPEDLKGMKVRIGSGQQNIDFYTALGASAQAMSWAEVYTALQQGTIDGHDNSLTTIYSNNIQEVQKYITVCHYGYELFIFTANDAWMSGLGADTQQLIRDCVRDACLEMDTVLEDEEAGIIESMRNDYGCEVYIMSEEEKGPFKEALTGFMATWTEYFGAEACEAFDIEMG